MKKTWIALGLCAFLSGCQLTSVEGECKDVEVKLKNKSSSREESQSFCPPGQAKKGRC
ncbi:hypothetical protein [Vibrio vulnificus]|uniref:hypothetical protein n=1 Tax=Vibrio vulnificus TaxID=672 RepID=UPI0013EE4E08|nr:hypothetical protein [Vibrio vulnificus]EHV2839817.1 hypothetical protein [Vibrio vulnificus]EIO3906220.1 hypothetical protein [Vibrio vulnificus]EJV9422149.1 hypothetical protein [Vibrio vulnificus]MCA3880708.1 hypothetical protein [Vibrio vulnificus]MCA3946942.1 hypothetical protein [Vibrio vulnificus]